MKNKNIFQYLNSKNKCFKGYDTILYDELIKGEKLSILSVVEAIKNINYYSNCNSVFEFYFPVVAHTLYYAPEYASEVLKYIVEPIFALEAVDNEDDFIAIIQDYADYNKKFQISSEGLHWTKNILPTQRKEIGDTILECKEELEFD